MHFDDFDKEMRKYEESIDQYIPEDKYIVVRLVDAHLLVWLKEYANSKRHSMKSLGI